MVLRIWKTKIDEARAEEYREFAQRKSTPMFAAQPGCLGALFAAAPGRRMVLTLWADTAAAQVLGHSAAYRATVAEIEATGFLLGDAEVETVELQGGFIRERELTAQLGANPDTL